MNKQTGILLHISSLPSKYGIGTLGKESYKFVDFLAATKQNYWQVLPINPTGYGDSPYQSPSAFAFNPYFISFDILRQKKLLKLSDYKNFKNSKTVDYSYLFENKYKILQIAFNNFQIKGVLQDFDNFCKENNFWLEDYAKFMAIKSENNNSAWFSWKTKYKFRKKLPVNETTENFWKFLQFEFHNQWLALKNYANSKNIKLIGDIPIYVAYDSCDVWANPKMFLLDKYLKPKAVAGCPPDYFSADGQLWGNPLYNYKIMEKNEFDWWIKRLVHSFKYFDKLRIDHFRGFESFYAIPYGRKDGKEGEWKKACGKKLFKVINETLNNPPIIAEDLGTLTPQVKKILKSTGYPGMKVMLFAFDSDENDYIPKNHIKNCVVYIGTHDNQTIKGWYEGANEESKQRFKNITGNEKKKDICTDLIITTQKSVANLTIIQMQDYMNLGDEARMNTPSTTGNNWIFRLKKNYATKKLIEYILQMQAFRESKNLY